MVQIIQFVCLKNEECVTCVPKCICNMVSQITYYGQIFEMTDENLLGKGGEGNVYCGIWHGEPAAFKTFEFDGNTDDAAMVIGQMQAAIEALKYLKGTSDVIELYTDSNYLRQGITEWIVNWKSNNWRTASKKPVANRDLWIEVDGLSSALNIEWHWVKGHDGDPGNERADYLANLGAESVS